MTKIGYMLIVICLVGLTTTVTCSLMATPNSSAPAPQWDYSYAPVETQDNRVPFPLVGKSIEEWLQDRGAQGWELVAITPNGKHFVFKRPK